MSTDLRDLLELASDDLPEVDLAEEAWDTARAERRAVRRRVVLGAGAVAVAGALVTVVVRDRDGAATDPADDLPVVPDRLPTALVGGVTVHLGPEPGGETVLPRYVEADALALPERLGFEDAAAVTGFGPGAALTSNEASVRAVLLAWTPSADGVVPVLYTPLRADG
ncbi:MAG TPA: hypothetical protein VFI44_02280, partial [Ornithinibacter sp.]|nr:hypothetical protein [Ornithinibacter sp.]